MVEGGAESAAGGAEEVEDAHYALGQRFLGLVARASREDPEGAPGAGRVVGTALHVAVVGPGLGGGAGAVGGRAPPSCGCVCLEPSTGEVVDVRVLEGARAGVAMEAFEEALWGVVEGHLRRVGPEAQGGQGWKPALLTTFDVALADYLHALLQGSGTDVVCVGRGDGVPVQFPRGTGGCEEGDDAAPPPLLCDAVDGAVARLVMDGVLPWAGDGGGAAELGACQAEQCMSLHQVETLSVCAGCQRARYCSRACQLADWKRGGHKALCKEIQAGAKESTPEWA